MRRGGEVAAAAVARRGALQVCATRAAPAAVAPSIAASSSAAARSATAAAANAAAAAASPAAAAVAVRGAPLLMLRRGVSLSSSSSPVRAEQKGDGEGGGGWFSRLWRGGGGGSGDSAQPSDAAAPAAAPTSPPPPPPPPPPPSASESATVSAAAEKAEKKKSSLGRLGEKAMESMKGPEAVELERRLKESRWDLDTYRLQLIAQQEMGKKAGMLKYMPGTAKFKTQVQDALDMSQDESQAAVTARYLAILDNMTDQQKSNPSVLNKNSGLGKLQLAKKSDATAGDVQDMLDQYTYMSIMFKHMFALRAKGVELPDDIEGMMAAVMEHASFTPNEMKIMARAAAGQGMTSADTAAGIARNPKMMRRFGGGGA